jgi:four helix bundle protein
MKDRKELRVWQGGVTLVTAVYRMTQDFPKPEMYGLTAQIRRAAISVPSSIAEGWARASTREYIHFLTVARGSLAELETQLIIAKELAYLRQTELDELLSQIGEVGRALNALTTSLRRRLPP